MLNKCQVEVEVERLNILKTSKMRELIFKRQAELEEIYRGVHMDIDGDAARKTLTSLIDSGLRHSIIQISKFFWNCTKS